MEQTQTTVTPSPDLDEHDRLEAEAYAADAADAMPDQASSAQQDASEGVEDATRADASTEQTDKQPDSPEPSAEKADDRPRGPDGKFLKKDEAPPQDKAEASPKDTAPAPTKEQKEQARKEKTWQQIEQEKLEVRETKARLEKLEQELKTLAQRPPASDYSRFDSKQYSRASYEFAERAKKLFKDGDVDGGMEQLGLAEQTSQAAVEAQKAEAQEQQQKFASDWQNTAREVIREVPELGDGNSPLSKEMTQLLTEQPVLGQIQDGFRHAYEILRMRHESAEASGLREENTKLKQEIERLTKLATPSVSKDAARHSSGNDYNSLSLDELHKKLEREAEMADAA